MRRLLVILCAVSALAAVPAVSEATRCTGRCRDRARVCKERCKIGAPTWRARHDCLKACRLREINCKARCP